MTKYMIVLKNYERPENYNQKTDDQIIEYKGKYYRVPFGYVKIVSKTKGSYKYRGLGFSEKYNESDIVPATKDNIRKQILFNLNYASKGYYDDSLRDAKKYGIKLDEKFASEKQLDVENYKKYDRDYLMNKHFRERMKLKNNKHKG